MKITELFKNHSKTFSFEFFPPKDEISAVDFGINMGQLMKLNPSFVTVTYGAGGSTQDRTFELVNYIQNKLRLTCMAHYTCVNAPQEKIAWDIKQLETIGIENLMLLRGDPPEGRSKFIPAEGGFKYASELIEFIGGRFNFCKAGACYVDKHPEAESLQRDIENLKIKVDAGTDFLITQLFFVNNNYFRFIDMTKEKGIICRIIPGIIPLTSYKQIDRFTKMSQAEIPEDFKNELEKYKEEPKKIYQLGMDFTIKQCRDLLHRGAPGIHFYTLNKSRAAVEVFETLSDDLEEYF